MTPDGPRYWIVRPHQPSAWRELRDLLAPAAWFMAILVGVCLLLAIVVAWGSS